MAFNYLKVEFDSRVLAYDNEELPLKLSGVKMLPIVTFNDGTNKNESLDIIKSINGSSKLFEDITNVEIVNVEKTLVEVGKVLHPLAMPAWLNTPEFVGSSKEYFRLKKEKKRGPFSELIKKEDELKSNLTLFLSSMKIEPQFLNKKKISILDIMLTSHLYGLYVLCDFNIPANIHDYLQLIRNECSFKYHEDYRVDRDFSHWNEP